MGLASALSDVQMHLDRSTDFLEPVAVPTTDVLPCGGCGESAQRRRRLHERRNDDATMTDQNKERAARATVTLPRMKGRGVLVPGEFILTAAHCIEWDGRGKMGLGKPFLAPVQPRKGRPFLLSVYAVDPVSNIAALGEADDLSDDAEAFEEFRETTQPIPICADDFELERDVRLHFLTVDGQWASAIGTRHGFTWGPPDGQVYLRDWLPPDEQLCLRLASDHIARGTSGGPVIDRLGRLVGIISNGSGDEQGENSRGNEWHTGMIARPHLALPCWVWRIIEKAQRRRKPGQPRCP
jgi:hypothetical protein